MIASHESGSKTLLALLNRIRRLERMPDQNDIDFREQLQSYVSDPENRRVTLTLLSGDRYTVTREDEIVILRHVVFIMLAPSLESMFPFEAICNVDVIRFK